MSEKLRNDSGFGKFIVPLEDRAPKDLPVVDRLGNDRDGTWVALVEGDGWFQNYQRISGVWVRCGSPYYPATMD